MCRCIGKGSHCRHVSWTPAHSFMGGLRPRWIGLSVSEGREFNNKVSFTVTPVYKLSALPQHLQTYFQNKDCACPPLVRTCKYCMHALSQLYTEMYMYIYLNMCRLSQTMHIYLLCVIKFFDKLTRCSCMMLEGRCSE